LTASAPAASAARETTTVAGSLADVAVNFMMADGAVARIVTTGVCPKATPDIARKRTNEREDFTGPIYPDPQCRDIRIRGIFFAFWNLAVFAVWHGGKMAPHECGTTNGGGWCACL